MRLFITVCLVYFIFAVDSLVILPSHNYSLRSVPLYYGRDSYGDLNTTGTFIYYLDPEFTSLPNLSGFIVVFDYSNPLIYVDYFLKFQQRGAEAVICYTSFGQQAGNLMYMIGWEQSKTITIPIAQLDKSEYNVVLPLVRSNDTIVGTVTFSEINPWKQLNEGPFMIFWAVAVGLGSLFCVVLAAVLLVKLLAKKRPSKFAIVCLIFEIIGNFSKILYCIDPIYSFRIFPHSISAFLLISSFYYTIIPTCLMAFYLHNMTKKEVSDITSLNKCLKIPFITVMVLLTLAALVTFVLLFLRETVLTATSIYNVAIFVVSIAMSIYFLYVSIRIFKFLPTVSMTPAHKTLVRKLKFVLASVVTNLLSIIAAIYIINAPSPIPNKVAYFISFYLALVYNAFQIMVFAPSEKVRGKDTTSTKSKNSTKNSKNSSNTSTMSLKELESEQ